MEEIDYLRATHIARARIALEVVRDIMPDFDGVITESDHAIVRKILSGWVDGLFQKLNPKDS